MASNPKALMEPLIGYDGIEYIVGSRVELHPGLDWWMRGARFGTVVGIRSTSQDRVRVQLDAGPFIAGPEDRFRKVKD